MEDLVRRGVAYWLSEHVDGVRCCNARGEEYDPTASVIFAKPPHATVGIVLGAPRLPVREGG